MMNSSHAGLQVTEEEKVRAGKAAVVIGGTKLHVINSSHAGLQGVELHVMNSSHAGLQGADACNVQGIGGGISRDQSVWWGSLDPRRKG